LTLLGGVGVFVVTVVLFGLSSVLLGASTETLETADKARILAKNISALMNLSFLGLPFGSLVGIVAEFRARRPPNKPLQQTGSPP
jgi:hypothetical protein